MGSRGLGSYKVQTSGAEINQSLGCEVRHNSYGSPYCVVYLKAAKREDLKSSYCKKTNL